MSLRTSATRYANALLDVAIKEADAAQVERDLSVMVDAIQTHAELRRVLTSPRTPAAARAKVVKALTAHANVQRPVAKLLDMLADRGRLELLPELLDVYRERLLAHRNVVRATVTAAMPLGTDRVEALAASLSTLTGKKVHLETAVDPAIIGGLITRIGSMVYDGSIRTQLQKMKRQLMENA